MARPVSDVAFTPSVKAEQEKRGSRRQYRRMEEGDGWNDRVTPDLAAFLSSVRSFYLGTTNAEGQPYIQHRGGPPGFLTLLDDKTIAFADYGGNKQYITLGNLTDNPRAFMFVMDYARRLRIKFWGKARVVEDDPELAARVSKVTSGSVERVIVFEITAWDRNCNQHIPRLVAIEDVARVVEPLEARIAALESELAEAKKRAPS